MTNEETKAKKRETARLWNAAHPERHRELSAISRRRIIHNPRRLSARRAQVKAWYEANKDRAAVIRREWLLMNSWAQIADAARSLIRSTLKNSLNGGPRLQWLVGCTGQELRDYLERQWLPGMSWANYGRGGWTVGHKKACALFKHELLKDAVQQACFHYTNLQPEWERSNLLKHTKPELTAAQKALEEVFPTTSLAPGERPREARRQRSSPLSPLLQPRQSGTPSERKSMCQSVTV